MQRTIIVALLGAAVVLSVAACETTGPRYRNVRSYSEGLAPAQHASGKWGFVNERQEWVIQPKFDDAKEFQVGKAAVRLGNKWGFIDKRGEWL